MEKQYPKKIKTKFGTAIIHTSGHYRIANGEYHNQYFHRLIWEEARGKIPEGKVIHHIDGNKLNNDIYNLQLMTDEEHKKLHKPSNETRARMSKAQAGKPKSTNSSGFYGVDKQYDKRLAHDFTWRYRTTVDSETKQIKSVNLLELEKKVKSSGLPWIIVNEENARKSIELNNKYYGE